MMSQEARKIAKQSKQGETPLSAQDLVVKKYCALDQRRKELEKELRLLQKEIKPLKDDLKHRGSHSTRHYVVTVERKEVAGYTVEPSVRESVTVKRKEEA